MSKTETKDTKAVTKADEKKIEEKKDEKKEDKKLKEMEKDEQKRKKKSKETEVKQDAIFVPLPPDGQIIESYWIKGTLHSNTYQHDTR